MVWLVRTTHAWNNVYSSGRVAHFQSPHMHSIHDMTAPTNDGNFYIDFYWVNNVAGCSIQGVATLSHHCTWIWTIQTNTLALDPVISGTHMWSPQENSLHRLVFIHSAYQCDRIRAIISLLTKLISSCIPRVSLVLILTWQHVLVSSMITYGKYCNVRCQMFFKTGPNTLYVSHGHM